MPVAARRDAERGWRLASLALSLLTPSLAMLALSTLVSCGGSEPVVDGPGTGGRVEADNDAERRILAQADTLPSGKKTTVGPVAVVAAEPYDAASGRRCRWLTLFADEAESARRLACKNQAGWFFAPDVLGPPLDAP